MEDKRAINLIWDMDGTIVDSYPEIMERIRKTLEAFNISDKYSDEYIYSVIIHNTVGCFNVMIANDNNIDFDEVKRVVHSIKPRVSGLMLMPHMKEFLEWADNNKKVKINNYIFTHRGKSNEEILKNLEVNKYFIDCVDSSFGFPIKPNPAGLEYLIEKYNMDRSNTYYIGDRVIDTECGKNANIKSVFYNSSGFSDFDTSSADYVIYDIEKMKEILGF